MKKVMIILLCGVCSLAVFAQDSQSSSASTGTKEINTLFGKGSGTCKIPMGYFIELNGEYTRFGHKNVFLPGISMGLILDHHWTIGATGNFISSQEGLHFRNIYYDSTTSSKHGANLNGGYGGLLLEYTLFQVLGSMLSFL